MSRESGIHATCNPRNKQNRRGLWSSPEGYVSNSTSALSILIGVPAHA